MRDDPVVIVVTGANEDLRLQIREILFEYCDGIRIQEVSGAKDDYETYHVTEEEE